jgi:uncharacterized protein (DUF952 family)
VTEPTGVPPEQILHVAARSAWEEVRTAGMYRAESLASEGFIHFSSWSRLTGTAGRYYAGMPDLVVLVADPAGLDVRVEASPSTGESFPHLYEPLPVPAVLEVLPLEAAPARAAVA